MNPKNTRSADRSRPRNRRLAIECLDARVVLSAAHVEIFSFTAPTDTSHDWFSDRSYQAERASFVRIERAGYGDNSVSFGSFGGGNFGGERINSSLGEHFTMPLDGGVGSYHDTSRPQFENQAKFGAFDHNYYLLGDGGEYRSEGMSLMFMRPMDGGFVNFSHAEPSSMRLVMSDEDAGHYLVFSRPIPLDHPFNQNSAPPATMAQEHSAANEHATPPPVTNPSIMPIFRENRSAADGGAVVLPASIARAAESTSQALSAGVSASSLNAKALSSAVLETRWNDATAQAASPLTSLRSLAIDRSDEGGLIEIKPRAKSDDADAKSDAAKESPQPLTPDLSAAEASSLDAFWEQFANQLGTARLKETNETASNADTAEAELAGRVAAIHAEDGGMVELTPSSAFEVNSAVVSAAHGQSHGSNDAREIKLDSSIALFQAFELETSPIQNSSEEEIEEPTQRADSGNPAEPDPSQQAAAAPAAAIVLFALTKETDDERKRQLERRKQALASSAKNQ